MVARQLQAHGIEDRRVLRAMAAVPRDAFLPGPLRPMAYDDGAVPIGAGQTMSQPWVVAYMAQALELTGDERVLDVGTGSGYAAAVLAHLAAEVVTVERLPELAERARATLAALGYDAVRVEVGDGSLGVPDAAPFDAISVAASAPAPPASLVEQLADGGRMVVPVAGEGGERLTVVRRRGGDVTSEVLTPVRFVPLIGREGFAAAPGR
jgi:protein-L-isoaspartate(D-aspartate) O-methyltransferase